MFSRYAIALLGFLSLPAAVQAGSVKVFTSYPQEMMDVYERAFTRAHPGTTLEFQWGHGQDATATLRQPDQGGVDVYWSPALKAFNRLANEGRFADLGDTARTVPANLGKMALLDPKKQFATFELAGYGFAVRPDRLAERHLPMPREWADLAKPIYDGQVVMPVPSTVGFAPPLYDFILQRLGWAKGWEVLAEMSANAQLLTGAGGIGLINELVDGDKALGLGIDFFVRSAISEGKPVRLIYPAVTIYSPAQVAITASTRHRAEAESFVRFVLSAEGQALLLDPAVMRLPVLPAAYAKAPQGFPNPYADPGVELYDPARGSARLVAVSALFDQMITNRHGQLKELFALIRQAEAAGDLDKAARARALIAQTPVGENQMADRSLNDTLEKPDSEAAQAITTQWGTMVTRATRQAFEVFGQ